MLNILKLNTVICSLIIFSCFFGSNIHAGSADIVQALSEIGFFSEFKQAELELLAEIAGLRKAEEGEYLFTQDKLSGTMYFLIEGSASVYSQGQFIVTLEAPQIFGEVELVDRMKASADVIVKADSRIIEFKYDELIKLLDNNCEIGYKFMKQIVSVLSERLINMNP